MSLIIDNPALEADLAAIARLTGETPDEALLAAVRERRARLGEGDRGAEDQRALSPDERIARVREIQAKLANFPQLYRTSNHEDLYDDHGLPK